MRELCHRCHGELPQPIDGNPYNDEGALLFCPRCGAPQILLQDHLRVDPPPSALATTGTTPPPLPDSAPGKVDWRAALSSIVLVAAVAAALELIGFKSSAVSFLSALWTIGGAVIALGLYARHRPRAWMDARVGLRVGVATGLLMVAAMGTGLAVAGTIARFGTHSMASFDAEVSHDFDIMHQQMVVRMQEQGQPADAQAKVFGIMGSQEARAGIAVFYLGLLGALILLISAGGGAFAGMLRAAQAPRAGQARGD